MPSNVLLTPDKEARIITDRALHKFAYHQHVRYRLLVVNDYYNHQYNFFLEWHRPAERSRSIPLHSLHNYDLAYLRRVLLLVQTDVGFSVSFRDFARSAINLLQKS